VDEKSLTWLPQTPVYRKRKKHDASDLDNQFYAPMKTTVKDKGLLCKDCHKWRAWSDLVIVYERQGTDVIRMWICTCGDVLRQDNLNEMEGAYDTVAKDAP
jgi:hypothetical protein